MSGRKPRRLSRDLHRHAIEQRRLCIAPSRPRLHLPSIRWIMLPPIQRVFLYELDAGADGFAAVVERLKRVLADMLAHYLPLAGTLEYTAETGDAVVDCSGVGVAFVEANRDADVRRLLGLVPELDARALLAPVLSVQGTRLNVGAGLAVSVSVHHAVADGCAVWRFMEAWSSASRMGSERSRSID